MVGCASCGSANPEGFRFCGACAEPLTAPAPVREERKTVTVLFADLAGFTVRSDGADPEDVLALVRPFHGILRHETEAFGGTLAGSWATPGWWSSGTRRRTKTIPSAPCGPASRSSMRSAAGTWSGRASISMPASGSTPPRRS